MTDELYREVSMLLDAEKIQPSISVVAKKAFALLQEITASHKSEIVGLERWVKMYRTRHKTLLQKQRNCGGFDETLSSIESVNGKVDLILLESNPYVSMFLLNRDSGDLIGALYIERDQNTI